ncbi:F-box/FBD/LRR-repeat protein-like protein isoform X2 [Tanacetum coccineum]
MVDEDQLEEQLFAYWSSERKKLMLRCKQFFDVHQVHFMHQALILGFTFSSMEPNDDTFIVELFNIIELFKCLPVIEDLTISQWIIEIDNNYYFEFKTDKDFEIRSHALKDCFDIWLEHLEALEIRYFDNLKHEMKFVKLILERAPMLKKARIVMDDFVKRGEELKIARHVSCSRCVSPFAEIIV